MDRSDRPWGGIYMGFWEFGSVIHCVRFGDFFCFATFGGRDRGILLTSKGHAKLFHRDGGVQGG